MAKKTIYRAQYRVLIEHLRLERERLGMAQTQVSRLLGWPQQRLSAVEAGARRLDVLEFFELAGALGMTQLEAVHLVQRALRHQ